MKKIIMAGVLAIFSLSLNSGAAIATTETTDNSSLAKVASIALTGEGSQIKWAASSISSQGFKIVWSKNENPVYPCREGDQYHYYANSDQTSDTLAAFSGAGIYYIRVCEYLGGKCGTYSNQIKLSLGETAATNAPVVCTTEYAPVCGTDGKTYSNKCVASAAGASIKSSGECGSTNTAKVNSITLHGASNDPAVVEWTVDGNSAQGFKVVWSKTQGPTYPLRDSDRYHYYSDPAAHRDTLEAFDGSGTYYVRVCEYLGGKCGVYSNESKAELLQYQSQDQSATITHSAGLTKIDLKGEANKIEWGADGYATNGFKIVWSMKENPTYPIRTGDQYHYLSSPAANNDFLVPFAGNGTYFVRVCEYSSAGTCNVYSNQISVVMNNSEDTGVKQITEIRNDASDLYNNKIDSLLSQINELKDIVKEQQVKINYLLKLQSGLSQPISAATERAVSNFIAYGVDANSKNLGEGERAAVMYSFKAAFNKLPETQSELEDAIKIANGRWPSLVSDAAEAQAEAQFKKIYLREADLNNPHDAAAVKVMAYGLRQQAKNRSLNSEAAAIKTYKAIFKHLPGSTADWNALQAITYSGAIR